MKKLSVEVRHSPLRVIITSTSRQGHSSKYLHEVTVIQCHTSSGELYRTEHPAVLFYIHFSAISYGHCLEYAYPQQTDFGIQSTCPKPPVRGQSNWYLKSDGWLLMSDLLTTKYLGPQIIGLLILKAFRHIANLWVQELNLWKEMCYTKVFISIFIFLDMCIL